MQDSLWLIGVLSCGDFGLVGPFLLALTTPGALGFGVPYWNLGTFWLAAADWVSWAAARPAEKRAPTRAREALLANMVRGEEGKG